ncbi:electron transfer flavoprotein subunit alpha/FixB family protein [bacterium]|nr:electron transfer flavoprotein subunit alpha/FixB family protein [candidate division CSSED10-310 bacterium]
MAVFLVFAEQRQGVVRSVAMEAVSAARAMADRSAGEVVALALGSGPIDGLARLGEYGAHRVVQGRHELFGAYSAEAYAAAIAKAARSVGADYVILTSSAEGKDFGPRVAARLDAGFLADVIGMEWRDDRLVFTRPIYAGKAYAVMSSRSVPQVVTLRPKMFTAVAGIGGEAQVESLTDLAASDIKSVFREFVAAGGGRLDVTEADVIVSGGRGLGGAANFAVLEPLAEVLNGVVGASRAAVDAGWIEHAQQVGQTGKVVTPSLYIACGISGAIQHLAGMSNSKVIVAINKDPEAAIFQVADYGIVGDLFEVVPALVEEIKKVVN